MVITATVILISKLIGCVSCVDAFACYIVVAMTKLVKIFY